MRDGKHLGLSISFKEQKIPLGIAEAFLIGKDFIGNNDVCLILGDNIFHGKDFVKLLIKARENLFKNYSTIFGVKVNNPNDFGVIELDSSNNPLKIIEKPKFTKSKLIVSGLYFYTNDVVEKAKKLKPSKRNELEISDLNNLFINNKMLKLIQLDSNFSWLDTGTYDSLIKASKYFQNLENQTGKKYACIEEIVYDLGYISKLQFQKNHEMISNSSYGDYLKKKI